ncbi:CaiB/BaiF CoA transferase family protein [Saccharospirillum sp.]|uniref:CaiB/BaiF CoA transferase family protein n=1 Tax=Saccharospirillum sp. TaxID=2033801 RepID=UPI0034A04573
MSDDAIQGALSGIRVIDLSRILAGPWATQMLADFGAEVIKIERPGQGDDTRGWGPPFFGDDEHKVAAYFHSANRGKQSIAIDFTRPEGQQLVHDLVREADVLVENYKVDGLKKYRLDYDSLKAINPRLVYCSITGFGQTGPYKHRAGYDFMIQGMGGLMSVTGEPDGTPMKVGVALTDILTGLYAANAVQAALHYRARTGLGQHIDLALLDVQVATMANQAMNYLATGNSPGRLGNAHPNIVPYQAFATADGYLILAVGNDGQFQRFCEVAGRPDLSADERFATNQARVAHREQLLPVIIERMKTQTRDWWLDKLEAVSVPCGPINSLEQVFADPQVQARELKRELNQPELGKVPSVANPIRFSESTIHYERAAPSLGSDTDHVLTGLLDCDASRLAFLRKQGIVG